MNYQDTLELHARHEALLKLLETELSQIAPNFGSYDVTKAFYRDPIHVSAPTRLLDGRTLEFHKDGRLIELLLNLNVAIARHNDFVQMTNLAQATSPVSNNLYTQWFQEVQRRITALTVVRDDILNEFNHDSK